MISWITQRKVHSGRILLVAIVGVVSFYLPSLIRTLLFYGFERRHLLQSFHNPVDFFPTQILLGVTFALVREASRTLRHGPVQEIAVSGIVCAFVLTLVGLADIMIRGWPVVFLVVGYAGLVLAVNEGIVSILSRFRWFTLDR